MGDERWWCEEKFGKKNTALYQPLGTLGVYFHLYAFWKMVEFGFRMVWVDWHVMIKKERGSLLLKRLTKDFKWLLISEAWFQSRGQGAIENGSQIKWRIDKGASNQSAQKPYKLLYLNSIWHVIRCSSIFLWFCHAFCTR